MCAPARSSNRLGRRSGVGRVSRSSPNPTSPASPSSSSLSTMDMPARGRGPGEGVGWGAWHTNCLLVSRAAQPFCTPGNAKPPGRASLFPRAMGAHDCDTLGSPPLHSASPRSAARGLSPSGQPWAAVQNRTGPRRAPHQTADGSLTTYPAACAGSPPPAPARAPGRAPFPPAAAPGGPAPGKPPQTRPAQTAAQPHWHACQSQSSPEHTAHTGTAVCAPPPRRHRTGSPGGMWRGACSSPQHPQIFARYPWYQATVHPLLRG